MKKIAIVYHSGYGHTEVLANHVVKGAESVKDVTVTLYKAEDITKDPRILNKEDAIIFGAPTYMGSASGPFKVFMDKTSELWFKQEWKDKIAAGFTNSHSLSGDKLNVLLQFVVFASQHGMIWVGQAEMNGSPDFEPGKADTLNRMGSSLGLMAQSENDSPDITPPEGDLKTARLFGQRVAEITKRFQTPLVMNAHK